MSWILAALVGAVAALVTLLVCWWRFGRKLKALRRELERALPTGSPATSSLTGQAVPSADALAAVETSLERLESELSESEGARRTPRPFLDTSPLTHEVGERTETADRRRQ